MSIADYSLQSLFKKICKYKYSQLESKDMPIDDFEGDTFVAFIDISGFKELMKDENRTIEALDKFYSTGYDILHYKTNLNGIFISDCGIIFIRDNPDVITSFSELLKAIQEINSKMLGINVMLTSSIAFGGFKYRKKIEFRGIDKNSLHGGAYLAAYLANEKEEPKMEPGQCRIVTKDLPPEIGKQFLENRSWCMQKQGNKFYNYYWMIKDISQIEEFTNDYQDTYQRKYTGMLSVLRKYNNKRQFR
jgi:hypothetical protein